MKKLRILTIILAVCVLLAGIPSASAAELPELASPRVLLGDADSDRILLAKDADTKCAPASVTKIMTLLLAAEAVERGDISLDSYVTASSNCRFDLSFDSSTAYIYQGETMRFEDVLHCAALISANEACNIIAENVAGTVSGFVERMNERALQLGCENTHFVNTHGLPDEEHYTTARDLYLIAREGLRHEVFRKLVGTVEYTTAATNASGPRHLKNSNALINKNSVYSDKYFYEGAIGIKTGHTDAAGFCLASAAEKDGVRLIAIVLGGGGNEEAMRFDNFADAVKLFDWAFESFSPRQIVAKGAFVGEQKLRRGDTTGEVKLCTGSTLVSLADEELRFENMERELVLYDEVIRCPVGKGTKVGELHLRDEYGNDIGTVGVVTAEELPPDEPVPSAEPLPETTALDRSQQIAIMAAASLLVLAAAIVITLATKKEHSRP